ncbi:hypothetical protein PsorP6_010557 [Peronosclerospora sorghi]|uniref:Uncharacterized protein n=1 Tax=Peronosclerospora sorghi TaxID=230839 RepID=A0ACC0VV05_9STRA|nr:hypothetical protein PsorP6_010557 [Peronosclerospora sorghi]
MLVDLQLLGYYHAQDAETQEPFVAYVLQVTTNNSPPFRIYRRYAELAAFAAQLQYTPPGGFPPPSALNTHVVAPLERFVHHLVHHLTQQQAAGLQHDVHSTVGRDLQLVRDFVAQDRNRPPNAVTGVVPAWAEPLPTTWTHQPDERDETSGTTEDDAATTLRNEVGQVEGSLSALWHCLDAYKYATSAWWRATCAVVDEYERMGDVSLLRGQNKARLVHRLGHVVAALEPPCCDEAVRTPLARLRHHVLPEVRETYWTRHKSGPPDTLRRRLGHERTTLQTTVRAHLDTSLRAFVDAHTHLLSTLATQFEALQDEEAQRSSMEAGCVRHKNRPRTSANREQRTVADTKSGPNDVDRKDSASNKMAVSIVPDRMDESTVPNKMAESTVPNKMAESTVRDKMNESTVPDKIDVSTVPDKMAESTVPDKMAESTVPDRIDESTVPDRMAESTVPDKMAASTVPDKMDESAVADKMDESTVPDKMDESTDPKHADECTVLDKVDEGTHRDERTVPDKTDEWTDGDGPDQGTVPDTPDAPRSQLYVWGRPPSFEVGAPVILRPTSVTVLRGQCIVQVACGGERVLYLTSTGDVYSYGEVDEHKMMPRPDDSSSSCSPRTFRTPHLVQPLALAKALHATCITSVACGAQHSVALTATGEVYTWGSGEDGRLGHGDMRDRSVPRKVMHLLRDTIVHASCGGAHTAVLSATGTVFTFGRGRNGRLGVGDLKCRETPTCVTPEPPSTRFMRVVCGWNFTLAVDTQGHVWTWGKTGEGQCGMGYMDHDQVVPERVPWDAPRVMDVACGYTHTLVLTGRGDVYAWGLGEYGQLGTGDVYQPRPTKVEGLGLCPSDPLARVYCGAFHSIATTENHAMFAWGLNSYGACGLGHTVNKDKPERIHEFAPEAHLSVACGHKYTIALEVYPAPHHRARRRDESQLFCRAPSPRHEKEEELRRAKKLWRTRILRDWHEMKATPLAHSLWRQGIPPSLRARVWPLAIGNRLKITPELYQIYRRRTVWYKKQGLPIDHPDVTVDGGREHTLSLIDTDLPRTFPSLKLFDATGPYYTSLQQLLETYACYRPELGYIQGMSYLAAMLCLHMPQDPYLTFQCLANLMVQEHLYTFYLLDVELARVYYTLFDTFLAARHPAMYTHFQAIGLRSSAVYLMNWLQTLFLQVLPLPVAARVLDQFLLDGTVLLFRVAMAIHDVFAALLCSADLDVVLPLLQRSVAYHDTWNAHVTEQALFDTVARVAVPSHVVSGLDRVVNDVFFYEKRRERDKRVGQSHASAAGGPMDAISDAWSGLFGGF